MLNRLQNKETLFESFTRFVKNKYKANDIYSCFYQNKNSELDFICVLDSNKWVYLIMTKDDIDLLNKIKAKTFDDFNYLLKEKEEKADVFSIELKSFIEKI